MIRRREDGISGRRRYTLVVDSRLSALSSRRLAATVDNRPSVTDATDRYDAGSGWYGREHCPLQSSTPVVPTGTDARNHLPGCPGLRDLPTGEVQGRVSPRSRRPTEARVESTGRRWTPREPRTLQVRSSSRLATWFLDSREVVARTGLARRPDAEPVVDDELRAVARAALVVSDEHTATDGGLTSPWLLPPRSRGPGAPVVTAVRSPPGATPRT